MELVRWYVHRVMGKADTIAKNAMGRVSYVATVVTEVVPLIR